MDRNNIKRLRCYNINCNGSAKLNENGKTEVTRNIWKYKYRKTEKIWHKIKLNLVTEEDIKEYEY